MAYLTRGMAWTEKREPEKAMDDFRRAIELDPGLANLDTYRRYRAAAESLDSRSQTPKFAEVVTRGLDAFEKGNYTRALLDFDEAIRLNPNHSEAHRWRGDALLNRREFDKALSAYEDAMRLDPNNAMAYLCSGMAWTEKRDFGKARSAFEKAVQLNPQLAHDPTYRRYKAAAESGRTSSPIPDLRQFFPNSEKK
jgi:tetratricopeptide (TPR) repeat protein